MEGHPEKRVGHPEKRVGHPEKSDKGMEGHPEKRLLDKVIERHFDVPNAGTIWDSVSFPLNAELYLGADVEELLRWSEGIGQALALEMEKHREDVMNAPSPEAGKYFDAVSLLGGELTRKNGDRIALHRDSFKGKHVLICCFHVPFLDPWRCCCFQPLLNLCKELYSTRDDFEMVMVARMNSLVADDEGEFDRFFSGFPDACLAVPFMYPKRRDLACKVLGLGRRFRWDSRCRCLLLNAVGSPTDVNVMEGEVLPYYGAEAFPFNEIAIKESDEQLRKVEKGRSTLEAVLVCNESSPACVHKFGGEKVLISQLSSDTRNSHVGLFLCIEGGLISYVADMYEQCREAGHRFDVVVVYMPFAFDRNLDPDIFKAKVDGWLQKLDTCQRWFRLPFNNSVSRRFWRLTRLYDNNVSNTDRDKLIVVGPDVEELDMYGADVMLRCGIKAYPFTVQAAYRAPVKELQKITLGSLLEGGVYRGGIDSNHYIDPGDLGRGASMTFLCIDHLRGGYTDFKSLEPIYQEMKERFGYELVFVETGVVDGVGIDYEEVKPGVFRYTCPISGSPAPSVSVSDEERRKMKSEMPWYICSTLSDSLKSLMRLIRTSFGVFIGCGDDGRIRSITYSDPSSLSLDDFSPAYNLEDFCEDLVNKEHEFDAFDR